MLKNGMVALVKYPWTAAIIGLVWLGSAALLVLDDQLPVLNIVVTNMVVTLIMAVVGFRVEK